MPARSAERPGHQPAPDTQTAAALYERALTCIAMEELTAAAGALRQAIALDPSHGTGWTLLADLLGQTGNAQATADAAADAAAKAIGASAAKQPRPRAPAKRDAAERQLRAGLQGRAPAAIEALLRGHLLQDPTDVPALVVLAETIMAQGRARQAERLLARALDLAPGYTLARYLHAVSLFRQGKEPLAIPHIQHLLAEQPRNIAYRTLLASSLALTGQVVRAIEIYEALIKELPKGVDLWISYAQALQHAGRREDSLRAFRTVLGFAPDCGQAHWSLQTLTPEKSAEDDIASMRAHLAGSALSPEARFHFEYALALALEKSGQYEESFAHYATGAKLRRSQLGYNPDDLTQRVARTTSVFSQAFLTDRAGQGCPDPAQIFIVGLPRAGSTLIEQILASHSAVEGTKELAELGHLASELGPRRLTGNAPSYPECLPGLGPDALAAIGRRYIARTRAYRVTGRPYFIDKMPANWIDTGLIALILPNAKIIDARRDPMATCFAAFKKYFSQGQAFSYSLDDLGRYYSDYAALMAHFDAVAPGRVHRVIYEDMVANTEAEIRRLLAYCGLAFEPACLRFWETERAVLTASSSQVRRPIFRDGLNHWRNFSEWLAPLREALGPHAEELGG